jgi:hypothetical protein
MPFGAFLAALLALLSAWLIWPLGWVFRLITGGEAPRPSAGATLARWLIVLAGVTGVTFVATVLVTFVQMALANDATLFYGWPRSLTMLATIWTLPALTVAAIACAALSWARGWWSIPGRVYYTFLTLAAIGCTATLAWMGVMAG